MVPDAETSAGTDLTRSTPVTSTAISRPAARQDLRYRAELEDRWLVSDVVEISL